MTVVLAGCGDLGTAVGLRFQALGHRVIGIRRHVDGLPDGFEGWPVDLHVDTPIIPDDTAVVVIALTADERSAAAYRNTYLHGLGHVLDGIGASSATPRVVLVSSTAVYDVSDGSVVTETTPATAQGPTAHVLRETEDALLASGVDAVVFRLGGLYGPGRERLITQVREGHARLPRGSLHTNRMHRDDAADAIVHLALLPETVPVCLGVDDEPAQLADVLRFLAAELGVDEPRTGSAGSLEGSGDKRCSNALLTSTGFTLTYPSYREGYRAVLAGEGVAYH